MKKKPEMNARRLSLVGDYDYNDQVVIKRTVKNIQENLDLHPSVIQAWLDGERFPDLLEERSRECYRKVLSQKNKTLEKLLDASHTDSFVDEYLFWEKEKCGQTMEEFSNGFVKYCNKHKYLHPDKKGLSHRDIEGGEKHFFVEKTSNEIMDEQIFKIRFNQYLQQTRLLSQVMENEFYKYLKKGELYREYFIPVEEAMELLDWLSEHPRSFRSKMPISEKDIEDLKKQANPVEQKARRMMKRTLKKKARRGKKVEEQLDSDNEENENEKKQIYVRTFIFHDEVSLPKCQLVSAQEEP